MLVDVAHASAATIDDVLAMATRPVVASHTGVRGVADNARNLSDEHLRGIAATGGLVGIGFWPTACGGDDVGRDRPLDPLRRRRRRRRARRARLGLRRRRPGPVRCDRAWSSITDALLDAGLDDDDIAKVMGGNALRLLARGAARRPDAAARPRSDELGDERGRPGGAVGGDRPVVDRAVDLERRWPRRSRRGPRSRSPSAGRRRSGRAGGATWRFCSKWLRQREVQERPPAGDQLHRRRQAALDHRQVARR